jgi:hypothetical protein
MLFSFCKCSAVAGIVAYVHQNINNKHRKSIKINEKSRNFNCIFSNNKGMHSRDEENVEELNEADNRESQRKAPHSSPVGQQHCHTVRLEKIVFVLNNDGLFVATL